MGRRAVLFLMAAACLFVAACEPGYDVSATNPCVDPVRVGFQANRVPTMADFAYEVPPRGVRKTWSVLGTHGDEVFFILLSGPRRADVIVRREPHLDIPITACPGGVHGEV